MNQRFVAELPLGHKFYLIPELARDQDHQCLYCQLRIEVRNPVNFGKPHVATIDHLLPKSRHGGNERSNLAAACMRCNNLRGSIDRFLFKAAVIQLFRKRPDIVVLWHDEDFTRTEVWREVVQLFHRLRIRDNQRYRAIQSSS